MYEQMHLPRDTQDDCLRRFQAAGHSFVDADVACDDLCVASGTIHVMFSVAYAPCTALGVVLPVLLIRLPSP